MNKSIVLLVGPPGSGKSTRAAELEALGYVRINQDSQGKLGHWTAFEAALEQNKNVVIDRMNFSVEQRNKYLVPALGKGYHSTIEVFHVPREVCLSRCMEREGHETINGKGIGPRGFESASEEDKKSFSANSALHTFFSKYERVADSEADVVTRHGWVKDTHKTKPAIICDLDGTLCNINHRLHFVQRDTKKDWKSFNAEICNDKVNTWCRSLIYNMGDNHPIVLCSGRDSSNRAMTVKWLEDNDVKQGRNYRELFMRPANDYRQDWIVKEIILDFELKTRYNILFAVDDRLQVVEMWRRHGIVCLQCAKGDF